jgi:hypothetical protein
MQGGASLTLAASLISLIYPVKIGGFGYGMVLYSLFKEKMAPSPPALLFAFVFIMATDVFSIFKVRSEALAARRQQQARAARQAALSKQSKKAS